MVGTLRFAHPTDPSHASTFSRHVFARALQVRLPLFEKRAQGMPGARCTRGLVCQKLHIWRTRAYRAAEAVRHPLRNGFTAYFVLSPATNSFLSPSSRELAALPARLSRTSPPQDLT